MLDWLFGWLGDFLVWLYDVLMWVPRKLWDLLLSSLLAILEAIPVPDWLSNAGGLLSAIPGGVWWFASALEIGYGIGVVLAAYGLRFLIRRIPLIG